MIVFPKILSQYMGIINANNVVLVEGRLSVKDDEIKLLAESVSVAPSSIDALPSSERVAPVTESKNESSKGRKGVFLRMDASDNSIADSIRNLVSIFPGNLPVYIYHTDTKQYDFLGMEYLVSVNKPLEKELKYILGEDNVVIKQ
jgi:DNA polymerase-3 subunit alpha